MVRASCRWLAATHTNGKPRGRAAVNEGAVAPGWYALEFTARRTDRLLCHGRDGRVQHCFPVCTQGNGRTKSHHMGTEIHDCCGDRRRRFLRRPDGYCG